MRGKTVLSSQRLEKWGVLRIVRDPDDLQRDRVRFRIAFDGFLNTLKDTLGTDKVTAHNGRQRERRCSDGSFPVLPKSGYTIALNRLA